jgi:hypothetical protein
MKDIKVTLHINSSVSDEDQAIVEREWELTDSHSPFWRVIYSGFSTSSSTQGVLNYPHTGDSFTFYLSRTGHRIELKDVATRASFPISISCATVQIFESKDHMEPVRLSKQEILDLFSGEEGWKLVGHELAGAH